MFLVSLRRVLFLILPAFLIVRKVLVRCGAVHIRETETEKEREGEREG